MSKQKRSQMNFYIDDYLKNWVIARSHQIGVNYSELIRMTLMAAKQRADRASKGDFSRE